MRKLLQSFALGLALFLGLAAQAAAKATIAEGYIIELDGQRIDGKVEVADITVSETKVEFYAKGQSKAKKYKPTQLLGYGYKLVEKDETGKKVDRWFHYVTKEVDYPPVPFGSKTVFMQREIEGPISLYCYYIEVRDDVKKPYRYYYYIEMPDGRFTKVDEENFVNTSKGLFKDYTALYARIGSKDFLYRNLDRMVRDYNYWTDNQHDRNEYRVAMKD